MKTQAIEVVEVIGEGLLVNDFTAAMHRRESVHANRTVRRCADTGEDHPCKDRSESSSADDAQALIS